MKIEVISQVTYCVDDLKKMLKYEDLKGELLPLPDDAVVSIQDGEVTARVAGLILSSAQPNQALRVRELKARIETANREREQRKRPYHRGALRRAVNYSNGLAISSDACLIFDKMADLGRPFTTKEAIEFSKIHSTERVRKAMKLLCKVEAARRISLKEAKQAELRAKWPHNRSVLWELTNKFMLSGAQEPKSDEASDES